MRTVWLLREADANTPRWLKGRGDENQPLFTTRLNEAIQFAREQDAEDMLEVLGPIKGGPKHDRFRWRNELQVDSREAVL